MELFNGLLRVIDQKGLRQKYGNGEEGRLLAYWLDGWPNKKPYITPDDCFWDKETDTHVFMDFLIPETAPELLSRIICYLDEIQKRGIDNYELHISTCAEEWLAAGLEENIDAKERKAEKIQGQFMILKKFITELYGKVTAGKVFLNVDGEYSVEERKSICNLLISNL